MERTDASPVRLSELPALVDDLRHLLDDERRALIADDAQSVEMLTARKTAMLYRLESVDERILEAANSRLREQLVDCYRLNSANGQLINAKHHLMQQALAVLRGEDIAPPVYDPHGQSTSRQRSRPLGSV